MKRSTVYGFTLIELLIVVSIIAILAAIAIPQFRSYKTRSYNSASMSDLQNVRTAEEALFADVRDYGASVITPGSMLLVGATPGTSLTCVLSPGVYAGAKTYTSPEVRNMSYTGATKHSNGDNAYGTEPETQTFSKRAIPVGTNLQDADIPPSTVGIDFAAPWAQIN